MSYSASKRFCNLLLPISPPLPPPRQTLYVCPPPLNRLLSCHLVHLDLAHLLTNLSALLPDCTALEEAQGPAAFTADLLLLGLAASTAYTAAALLQKDLLAQPAQYFSMVTVGASSLGFALKVGVMLWSV